MISGYKIEVRDCSKVATYMLNSERFMLGRHNNEINSERAFASQLPAHSTSPLDLIRQTLTKHVPA